jgi:hypothetical protein
MHDLVAHRRTRSRSKVLGAVVAAFLAVLVLVASPSTRAVADDNGPIPTPPHSGQFLESWALAPTGDDPSQPSKRAFMTYTLTPGTSASDSVSLWNYSDVQLTFHIYATDAFNNSDGEFSLLAGDQKAHDAGGWVTPAASSLTVDPHTRVDVPITVQVPAGASPGDHVAGIVASVPTSTTGPNGTRAIIDRRTGTRVYVRVPGKVTRALTVDDMSVRYSGSLNPLDGSADVTYTLRNVGNVRLGARQKIELTDLFGRTLDTRAGKYLQDLLPGAAVKLTQHFDSVPALVRIGASVHVQPVAPVGGDQGVPPASTYTAHAWAIPWLVVVALAVLLALWWGVRRLRRRNRPPRGPRATPGPGPRADEGSLADAPGARAPVLQRRSDRVRGAPA